MPENNTVVNDGKFKYDKKIIHDSILAYGKVHQSVVCMEECSELIKAVSKLIRNPKGPTDNLSEEMADVIICLVLLQKMYNVSDKDIQKWLDFKINRQKDRNYSKFIDDINLLLENDNNKDIDINSNQTDNEMKEFIDSIIKNIFGSSAVNIEDYKYSKFNFDDIKGDDKK